MSFTSIVMMMLLGSSVATAFFLQPFKEEPAASANSAVSNCRCQGESLQSIRKSLLGAFNLQVEPQLPAGGLDGVREQWRRFYSNAAHRAMDAAVPVASGYSVPADGGNSTNPKCCSMTAEIFMKDLGWDSWVIHPDSLTIVQCAACSLEVNAVPRPPTHTDVQDADSQVQVPCCQPTSREMVPVVYMDGFGTIVISSVELTRSCGCEHDTLQPPSAE